MNYGIKDGYQIRSNAEPFDDTPFTDEFQNEVYLFASKLPAASVLDVGCGSGYKLMKYFSDRFTIGFELQPTLAWLLTKYPQRDWRYPNRLQTNLGPRPRLVICADVIEHVQDPDRLLRFIQSLYPDDVVLSTPDRNLLGLGTEDGPPHNIHHVREWTHDELVRYVGRQNFFVSDSRHAMTTILHCLPKVAPVISLRDRAR